MKKWNKLMIKSGLLSVMIVGAVVFTASNANAGFFDALNDSLKAVSAEVEKAKDGLNKAQLKISEANEQVEKSEANVAEERKKIDVLKADGEAVATDVKATARDVGDLAASVAGE